MVKAVILAAGKSTRTYPLTLTKPKPLLKVGRKSLLEHNLEQLNGLVDEVIIVVGYRKGMIKNFLKNKRYKFKIRFVEQREQLGTGHALLQTERLIRDSFILLMGDDLYDRKDIKKCMRYKYCILAKRMKDPSNFGVLQVIGKNVKNIIEKPQLYFSNLANCALYVLDEKIFKVIKKLKKTKRGEYEITDAIKDLAKKEDINYVTANKWVPVGYPWNLFDVKDLFKIKGNAIGERCKIKGKVKNSIVMDSTTIEKGSIIEDSIIGENVYFKGEIKSVRNAVSRVKGVYAKAGKLGAVVGDNSKLRNVEIKAGVKIWPNKSISNKIIKEDVI
ncbi:NTP transferase domain-containing protein [Candidatus Woesearchaeota archaeon]|nr:NTP transferase domain-containing protein [Candidatus Woesearchaeota archaeon]